ncbi:MAG: hypothetical protein ABJ327_05705 [Litoreibacter sp.]
MPQKTQLMPALLGAVLIAFAFLPIPQIDLLSPWVNWIAYCFVFWPLLPLIILAIPALTRYHIPVALAGTLAVLVVITGGLATVLLAAFSGVGRP